MGVLLHAGYTVLVAADDGTIRGTGREGLYDFDARLLSRLVYRVDDEIPTLAGASTPGPHRWQGRLHAWSPARSRDVRGPALPRTR